MVDQLQLPSPFDLVEWVDTVAGERGRPIELRAMDLPAGGMCGLVVSLVDRDVIVFARDTSRTHQQHIVSHELAHLFLEHGEDPDISVQAARVVLPHLDPAMVQRVLAGRTGYGACEEEEAELVASLITLRVSGWSQVPRQVRSVPTTDIEVVDRLEASLRACRRRLSTAR